MGSLGLAGDPDGWLHAGYTINTLMDQLDSDLDTADRAGGSGLRLAWAGPVADAFTQDWGSRRARYEDLIASARSGASAIIEFGERLADLLRRAYQLEQYWCGCGLTLLDGAEHFLLPWGFEHMPDGTQLSLRQCLEDSERDIGAMWNDVTAAVDDLVTGLESVLEALGDFQLLAVGGVAWVLGQYLGGYITDPFSLIADGVSVLKYNIDTTASDALDDAMRLETAAWQDGSQAVEGAADDAFDDAETAVAAAGKFDGYADVAGHVAFIASAVLTVWQVRDSIRKHGVLAGIEDNAGGIASLAAAPVIGAIGVTVAAAILPEAAVGVGAVVIAGVVGVGVSYGVQWAVDHNKKTINHVVHSVGDGVTDAAQWAGNHVSDLPSWLTN
ncbi:hypothetical protein [Trebonia sp.]|uniref:hypothetical protein n=1 Tax=Trebonia sp. TaxID=2767075 RepID=UPI002624695A|nr:hypothetical protein [Trebonia sp.]